MSSLTLSVWPTAIGDVPSTSRRRGSPMHQRRQYGSRSTSSPRLLQRPYSPPLRHEEASPFSLRRTRSSRLHAVITEEVLSSSPITTTATTTTTTTTITMENQRLFGRLPSTTSSIDTACSGILSTPDSALFSSTTGSVGSVEDSMPSYDAPSSSSRGVSVSSSMRTSTSPVSSLLLSARQKLTSFRSKSSAGMLMLEKARGSSSSSGKSVNPWREALQKEASFDEEVREEQGLASAESHHVSPLAIEARSDSSDRDLRSLDEEPAPQRHPQHVPRAQEQVQQCNEQQQQQQHQQLSRVKASIRIFIRVIQLLHGKIQELRREIEVVRNAHAEEIRQVEQDHAEDRRRWTAAVRSLEEQLHKAREEAGARLAADAAASAAALATFHQEGVRPSPALWEQQIQHRTQEVTQRIQKEMATLDQRRRERWQQKKHEQRHLTGEIVEKPGRRGSHNGSASSTCSTDSSNTAPSTEAILVEKLRVQLQRRREEELDKRSKFPDPFADDGSYDDEIFNRIAGNVAETNPPPAIVTLQQMLTWYKQELQNKVEQMVLLEVELELTRETTGSPYRDATSLLSSDDGSEDTLGAQLLQQLLRHEEHVGRTTRKTAGPLNPYASPLDASAKASSPTVASAKSF